MKKLVLLLFILFTFQLFSQETDIVNRVVFSQMKQMGVNSEAEKTVFLEKLTEMRNETKDSTLITLIDVYSVILQNQEVTDKTSFSAINKDVFNNLDLKKYNITEDKFQGLTFINSKKSSLPKIYIVVSDNYAVLRMKVTHYGSNWIFMDKIYFLIDQDESYYIELTDAEREVVSGGKVKEIADVVLTTEDITFLNKISKDSEVDVKKSGTKSTTYKLSSKAKYVIEDMIDLYLSLTSTQ